MPDVTNFHKLDTRTRGLKVTVISQHCYATVQTAKLVLMLRLQRTLLPKMPFFVRQKVQISSKILPQIPNFSSFSPSEMRPFQQRITVTAVNLFYDVLQELFE